MLPCQLALTRALGFLGRKTDERTLTGAAIASLAGPQPVALNTFDQLNLQQFARQTFFDAPRQRCYQNRFMGASLEVLHDAGGGERPVSHFTELSQGSKRRSFRACLAGLGNRYRATERWFQEQTLQQSADERGGACARVRGVNERGG